MVLASPLYRENATGGQHTAITMPSTTSGFSYFRNRADYWDSRRPCLFRQLYALPCCGIGFYGIAFGTGWRDARQGHRKGSAFPERAFDGDGALVFVDDKFRQV